MLNTIRHRPGSDLLRQHHMVQSIGPHRHCQVAERFFGSQAAELMPPVPWILHGPLEIHCARPIMLFKSFGSGERCRPCSPQKRARAGRGVRTPVAERW